MKPSRKKKYKVIHIDPAPEPRKKWSSEAKAAIWGPIAQALITVAAGGFVLWFTDFFEYTDKKREVDLKEKKLSLVELQLVQQATVLEIEKLEDKRSTLYDSLRLLLSMRDSVQFVNNSLVSVKKTVLAQKNLLEKEAQKSRFELNEINEKYFLTTKETQRLLITKDTLTRSITDLKGEIARLACMPEAVRFFYEVGFSSEFFMDDTISYKFSGFNMRSDQIADLDPRALSLFEFLKKISRHEISIETGQGSGGQYSMPYIRVKGRIHGQAIPQFPLPLRATSILLDVGKLYGCYQTLSREQRLRVLRIVKAGQIAKDL